MEPWSHGAEITSAGLQEVEKLLQGKLHKVSGDFKSCNSEFKVSRYQIYAGDVRLDRENWEVCSNTPHIVHENNFNILYTGDICLRFV